MKHRVYLVIRRKSGTAYIGKGPDGRIEGEHNMEFHSLMKRADMTQWESNAFSSPEDALVAEATAIGVVEASGGSLRLVNIQRRSRRRFQPRYPFLFVDKKFQRFRAP